MTKIEAKGYSLWLQPEGKIYARFANIIRDLAKEYKGPIFQPHVTLLGEIQLPEKEVLEKTRQLAKERYPFAVTLGNVDYEDYYFRALFVRAHITDLLQLLHIRANKLFNMEVPPYMPHLSLLYGNYSADLKERIIGNIGLNQSSWFTVNGIHVIHSTGDESTWHEVGFIPF